ncbi:hypothetical protein [Paucibacter sp. DJ1R-11]|uniref:hypothetical protein n=1 Tax=Paucibacter sp. DJ1R-11 TaxID=2893556 RepID=UPI0021E35C36|nr:hypothetical protein [Paucibacter sp. DJ1R-11]
MTTQHSPSDGSFKNLIDEQLKLSPVKLGSSLHLGRAAKAASKDVAAAQNFAAMTDSFTDPVLAKLEQLVPERFDFGPFRARRDV